MLATPTLLIDSTCDSEFRSAEPESCAEIVNFSLVEPARQAYLKLWIVGRPDCLFLEMSSDDHRRWTLGVPLQPGRYRFRYYVMGDNGTLICHVPLTSSKNEVDGWDGLMTVNTPTRARHGTAPQTAGLALPMRGQA